MRCALFLYAALLACIVTTCVAGPVISSPTTARNTNVSGPPLPQSGPLPEYPTPQAPGPPSPLLPRALERYNVRGTNFYILIEVGARVVTSTGIISITNMLNGAFGKVHTLAAQWGWSGLLRGGVFKYGDGPQVVMWNANNHQLNIEALELALQAVFGYMQEKFNYGVAEFSIFDGQNEVGKGYLVTHVDR